MSARTIREGALSWNSHGNPFIDSGVIHALVSTAIFKTNPLEARASGHFFEGNLEHGKAALQSYSLMSAIPSEYSNVTVATKANIYFDGRVVSHSLVFADGSKKTLGLIHAGEFHFGTDKAERMEIVSGSCEVRIDGSEARTTFKAGEFFEVPAKSGFDISVTDGICEYICSFID